MNKDKSFRETIVALKDDELRSLYWNRMSVYLKFCRSDEALLGFGGEYEIMVKELQTIQDELSKRKINVVR